MRQLLHTEVMHEANARFFVCENCRGEAVHTVNCQYGAEHHYCDQPACRQMMAYTAMVSPS